MKRYICNICGKEFDEFDQNNGCVFLSRMCYGSKYDGKSIVLDMCVDCADNLIESCKIKPFTDHERFDSEAYMDF